MTGPRYDHGVWNYRVCGIVEDIQIGVKRVYGFAAENQLIAEEAEAAARRGQGQGQQWGGQHEGFRYQQQPQQQGWLPQQQPQVVPQQHYPQQGYLQQETPQDPSWQVPRQQPLGGQQEDSEAERELNVSKKLVDDRYRYSRSLFATYKYLISHNKLTLHLDSNVSQVIGHWLL
jgi:hypothetical protein